MEHNQNELNQIEQHNQQMKKQMSSVLNNINSTDIISTVKPDYSGNISLLFLQNLTQLHRWRGQVES